MYLVTVTQRTFLLILAMVATFLTALLCLALERQDLAYAAWIITVVMGVITGNLREEFSFLAKASSIAALITFTLMVLPYVPQNMWVAVFAPVVGAAIYVSRVTNAQGFLYQEVAKLKKKLEGKN